MARSFTGSGNYLEISANLISGLNDITYAHWVYPLDLTTRSSLMVSSLSSASNDRVQTELWASSDDFFGRIGSVNVGTTGNYVANQWQHCMAIFDMRATKAISVWRDGDNIGSTTGTYTSGTHDTFSIGRWNKSGTITYANCWVCEAAIWDVQLNAADAKALAAGVSPLMVRPDHLIHYWPIYGRSSPEPDLIGTANLTVTGTARQAHPKLILPNRPRIFIPAAAAPTGDTSNLALGAPTVTGFTTTDTLTQNLLSTLQLGTPTVTGFAITALETDISNLELGTVTPTGFTLTNTLTEGDWSNLQLGTPTVTGNAPTVTHTQNLLSNLGLGTATVTGFVPTNTTTTVGADVSNVELGTQTITGYTLTNTTTENKVSTLLAGSFTLSGTAPRTIVTGVVVPSRAPGAGSGAKGKRRGRGRAGAYWFVMVDGKPHRVSSLEEERELWEKKLEQVTREDAAPSEKIETYTIERKIEVLGKRIEAKDKLKEEQSLVRAVKVRRDRVVNKLMALIDSLR